MVNRPSDHKEFRDLVKPERKTEMKLEMETEVALEKAEITRLYSQGKINTGEYNHMAYTINVLVLRIRKLEADLTAVTKGQQG